MKSKVCGAPKPEGRVLCEVCVCDAQFTLEKDFLELAKITDQVLFKAESFEEVKELCGKFNQIKQEYDL